MTDLAIIINFLFDSVMPLKSALAPVSGVMMHATQVLKKMTREYYRSQHLPGEHCGCVKDKAAKDQGSKDRVLFVIKERSIVAERITELRFSFSGFTAGEQFTLRDGFPKEGTYRLFFGGQEHVCDSTVDGDRVVFVCPEGRNFGPGVMHIRLENETPDRYLCSPSGQFYFHKYVIHCQQLIITCIPSCTYTLALSPDAVSLQAQQNSSFLFEYWDDPTESKKSEPNDTATAPHILKLASVDDMVAARQPQTRDKSKIKAPRMASILFMDNRETQFHPKSIELTEVYMDFQ